MAPFIVAVDSGVDFNEDTVSLLAVVRVVDEDFSSFLAETTTSPMRTFSQGSRIFVVEEGSLHIAR